MNCYDQFILFKQNVNTEEKNFIKACKEGNLNLCITTLKNNNNNITFNNSFLYLCFEKSIDNNQFSICKLLIENFYFFFKNVTSKYIDGLYCNCCMYGNIERFVFLFHNFESPLEKVLILYYALEYENIDIVNFIMNFIPIDKIEIDNYLKTDYGKYSNQKIIDELLNTYNNFLHFGEFTKSVMN